MTARLIMKMRVAGIERQPGGVNVYTFRHPWREELLRGAPGAHVDIRLPDGKTRQYSLCGDPDDLSAYRVAIKREDQGRGASKWLHENLNVGDIAFVSTPRNNFPLRAEAKHHVLVAGGIGVTPFLAYAKDLARRQKSFDLHYCARSEHPPLIDELRADCRLGQLKTYFSSTAGSRRFDPLHTFADVREGTHVYCCGPQKLIDGVRAATAHWPEAQIHFEVFQPTLDENFVAEPFDVTLASTGETLRVPANKSALEVLRAHGLPLPSSCELGVCGSCECGFRDGIIIHRDSVLSTTARQDRMMLCVSRARVGVTLDL